MNEIRILPGASRNATDNDLVWCEAANCAETASKHIGASNLPNAARYGIVVPIERVSFFRVTLPAGNRRQRERALPFLIEDELIEPIDRYEIKPIGDLSPQPKANDRSIWVAALERDWLDAIRLQLTNIRSGDVCWAVEGWTWPLKLPGLTTGSVWALRADSAKAVFCQCGEAPVSLSLSQLDQTLAWSLEQAAAKKTLPGQICVATEDQKLADRLDALCARFGVSLERSELDRLPVGLSVDAFNSPWILERTNRSAWHREWVELQHWQRWRHSLVIAALLLLGETGVLLTHWALLTKREHALNVEAIALAKQALGPQATIVDPWLQVKRSSTNALHIKGRSVDDDFLPLLNKLSSALPAGAAPATELNYERGHLRAVMPMTNNMSQAAMEKALSGKGLSLQSQVAADRSTITVLLQSLK